MDVDEHAVGELIEKAKSGDVAAINRLLEGSDIDRLEVQVESDIELTQPIQPADEGTDEE